MPHQLRSRYLKPEKTLINIYSFYHFMFMKSKRGIAPLIATALLITLAIALGVVVMNFGRAQIEIAAQCAVDIDLKPVTLNDKQQVCYDSKTNLIFFIVENGNQINIDSLRMRAIGTKAVYVEDVPESFIEKTGTILKYVPYDINTYGKIRQIRLSPEITLYEETILCPEKAVVFENIRECET
jgi:hypothetical protein